MPFANDKKTFLSKLDKSKKGSVDEKAIPLITLINSKENYYTTSSCSGRVYFWQGSGKKNETEWLKVSHDLITEDFLEPPLVKGLVFLRLEAFIIHVCCKDLASAQDLLLCARRFYKKSCLLSISNKIIVEIWGSDLLEMPYSEDEKLLFCGSRIWLLEYINKKLEKNWEIMKKFSISLSS